MVLIPVAGWVVPLLGHVLLVRKNKYDGTHVPTACSFSDATVAAAYYDVAAVAFCETFCTLNACTTRAYIVYVCV